MAIFRRKSTNQKRKRQYLKLFDARISKGDKTVPTFANWMKNKGYAKKTPKKVTKKHETSRTKIASKQLRRSISKKEIQKLKGKGKR